MSLLKAVQLWSVVLLGLSHIGTRCDARAVNVSNTWTMPQEGLNVFYRFFRDRISWFEADAVCQFHHANLVTVDNSFQFDATRDLLRELDVNDIVWIGLMRPQSSERFMWANSRPLVTDTGYWAESLPLMDAPLCAVIDPIRDYRWHALRCGGPETASFLCEMPVPSWADSCILKDMPNLTMQYMADTASIELIRNCAEEGLIRQSCKGKEDRERALRELICPRERLEAQRINDITNSHFKSLQIINSIRTDNNENNDIELLPLGESYGIGSDISEQVQTEKNTVQRLIEQFNVDELMQADEPMSTNNNYNNGNSGFKIPGEIPKPVKKAAKKVFVAGDYQKKSKPQKYTDAREQPAKPQNAQPQSVQRPLSLDDMMMGDQPPQSGEPEMLERGQDDDVSNEIMAPLPHKKKILPIDLKTMAPITERSSQQQQASDEEEQRQQERREKELMEAMKKIAATTTTTTTTTTTAAPSTTTTIDSSSSTTTTQPTTTTTTTATAAIASSSSTTASPIATTTTAPQTNAETTTTATTTPPETTAEAVATFGSESPAVSTAGASAAVATETAGASATAATQSPATIGHPMHPQQPRSNVITEETQHPHIKESADNSHFIPPMLLVKSHYVPPLKHSEHGGEHHVPHRGEATTSISADSSATPSDAKEPKEPAATTINEESTPKVAVDLDASSATSPDSITTSTTKTTITTTASATETSTLKAAVEAAAEAAVVIAKELTRLGQTHAKLIDDSASSKNQAAEQMAEAVAARQPNVLSTAPKTTILKPVSDNGKLADNTTKIDNVAAAATTATSTTTTTTTTTAPASDVDMRTTGSAAISAAESVDNNKPHATLSTTATQEDKAATKEEVDEEEDAGEGEEGSAQAQLEPKEMTKATTVTATQAAELYKAPIKTTTTTTATTTTQTVAATQPEPKEAHKGAVEGIASTNAPTTPPTTTTGTITTASAASAVAQSATTTVGEVEVEGEDQTLATIPAKSARAINHHRGHGEHGEHAHGGFGHGHGHDHHRTTTEEPTSTHNFLKQSTEPPFHPNRKRVLTQPETVSYFKKILG